MRAGLALVAAAPLCGALFAAAPAAAAPRSLRFERDGRLVREIPLAELREACHETRI